MLIEWLQGIANKKLPYTVDTPEELRQIRLLYAAGMVAALFFNKYDAGSSATSEASAQILAITPEGRAALCTERQPFHLA